VLAAGAVAVDHGLDCFDVQVGEEGLPVGVRECKEDALVAESHGVRIPDLVGVSARQVETERFKRFAKQPLSDFVWDHALNIPLRASEGEEGAQQPRRHSDATSPLEGGSDEQQSGNRTRRTGREATGLWAGLRRETLPKQRKDRLAVPSQIGVEAGPPRSPRRPVGDRGSA